MIVVVAKLQHVHAHCIEQPVKRADASLDIVEHRVLEVVAGIDNQRRDAFFVVHSTDFFKNRRQSRQSSQRTRNAPPGKNPRMPVVDFEDA